jgi:hypothetical protein
METGGLKVASGTFKIVDYKALTNPFAEFGPINVFVRRAPHAQDTATRGNLNRSSRIGSALAPKAFEAIASIRQKLLHERPGIKKGEEI